MLQNQTTTNVGLPPLLRENPCRKTILLLFSLRIRSRQSSHSQTILLPSLSFHLITLVNHSNPCPPINLQTSAVPRSAPRPQLRARMGKVRLDGRAPRDGKESFESPESQSDLHSDPWHSFRSYEWIVGLNHSL
ncbi:hypothetical protein FOYG_08145 [Fusarium oxysporum NRRL 32931]|uniref:Uncharacterized protein n=1 Tax=Fusarium oxysporum NRRL 32931 TaxID=660029 RepID=W9ICZ2_FUSOX|nr:hypothetical protein FOYG_08145 [Fusarium oxysporum NRRL 32931]